MKVLLVILIAEDIPESSIRAFMAGFELDMHRAPTMEDDFTIAAWGVPKRKPDSIDYDSEDETYYVDLGDVMVEPDQLGNLILEYVSHNWRQLTLGQECGCDSARAWRSYRKQNAWKLNGRH